MYNLARQEQIVWKPDGESWNGITRAEASQSLRLDNGKFMEAEGEWWPPLHMVNACADRVQKDNLVEGRPNILVDL